MNIKKTLKSIKTREKKEEEIKSLLLRSMYA